MLFGDLPRVTQKPAEAEMIICTDGIHLKRVDYKLLFPESVVKVEQVLTSGTEIAKIGVGNDVFSIYAPTQQSNAVTGVRVNGRDVVSNHVADVTIPVTDVKLNGDSVVEGRVAKIEIPDLPEQFVADVVDENDISLLDENNVAHVTNSGGGHGDVVDVVDQEGTSLLDINKVAHVIGTAPLIIQPTLAYDLATEVTEAQSWADNSQHQWTAPEDCIIYTPYCSSVGYKFQSDWLWCAGLQYGPFGRNYIPMKKGDTVTILLRSPVANFPHLYYIPYKKAVAIPSELNQPWVDYANSRVVPYTSTITAYDQMLVDFTATSNGILIPALVHSGNRELNINVNDGEFTIYNKYTSNLNFDIFDGIPLSEGDNIKVYFDVSSGTVTGTVKFFPFATETNPSAVYSPIPDWMNYTSADKIMNRDLPATIGRYFWHNQQYSQSGTSGSYPTNFEVDGVSYCVDSRYDYGSTYDFYKSGRLYSSGLETFVTSPATNQQWILRVALLQAPIEMAELGTYVEGNPSDTASESLSKIKIGDTTYSVVSTVKEMMNYFYDGSRPATPNISVANRLVYFLATSAMSSSGLKPGNRDGHVLHIPWDGTNVNLSTQFAISHGDNPQAWIRAQNNGTWSQWFNLPRTKLNAQMAASKALCTSSDSNIETSNTTSTELGYLSGARGNIQGQIDSLKSEGTTKYYDRVILFDNGTSADQTVEKTLSDDINNYDEIEFAAWSNDGWSINFRCDVQEFQTRYPYVNNPAATVPHLLLCPFSNAFVRVIMGSASNKILPFRPNGVVYIKTIYGIRYRKNSNQTIVSENAPTSSDGVIGDRFVQLNSGGTTIYKKYIKISATLWAEE